MDNSRESAIVFAKKYLEDLLSFFGLNIDVHSTADEDVIELSVPSTHLNNFLIGQHGETMKALQYMVGSALRNANFQIYRVSVDVADYKKQRAERLSERALGWIKEAKEKNAPVELRPMNAADRRIVHKLAADHGLVSESAGEGRDRHIVLRTEKPNNI